MKKLTLTEQRTIEAVKLDYNKDQMFLHCKQCVTKLLKSADYKAGLTSPKEAMSYQASSYPFEFPDGTVENIVVVWCHLCENKVWDSRHMTHRY